MSKRRWNEKARKLARYISLQLCDVHRGAVLVTEEVACVFGNDGGDERAKLEVDYVSQALEDQGIEILGYSEVDELTWAMLARTAHVDWLTNVAWVGWNRACRISSRSRGRTPRAANRLFASAQEGIAQYAILQVLDERGRINMRRKRF